MSDAIERLRRHMYDEDGDIISEREVDEAFAAIDRALKGNYILDSLNGIG